MRVVLLFIDFYNVALVVEKGFPGSSARKESACNAGDPGPILSWEDPLEKG